MDRKDVTFVALIAIAVLAVLIMVHPHGGRPAVHDASPVLQEAGARYPITPP